MEDKMRGSRRRTSRGNWSMDSRGRRSVRAEEDEEALRWAALEKLPTYDRLRKSVFKTFVETKVVHREVDVRKLDVNDRQEFIDRFFRVAEEDNEKFLKKLRNRIDKVGITLPTVEVRFEHLTVEADCFVGDRALPTLPNAARNIGEMALGCFGISLAKKTKLTILKDASGIIKPSRMTLLLGPPSSGKTTLLLALAGKLDHTLKRRGEITYNGHMLNEFVAQKTSAYISQNDVHVGEMTVKETLDFSARCQGVGSRYDLLSELARREREAGIFPEAEVDLFMKAIAMQGVESSLITDYTLRILGLDVCRDTIVGDEMIRGISGGQKKRVTTGEMIVGPTKTLFMDEISTGLDSSTTFQIVKCLQQIVHLTEATIFMSLLQPAPETFDLFDDVILLSEGQIVYQGPRENIIEFFESCGFKCPERKGTADFLQEVTSRKDQEQYWADRSKPYRYIHVSEFAKRFKRFHVGLRLENELSVPYDKSRSHKAALVFKKYSIPKRQLLKANFEKEWLLIRRNSFVYVFKTDGAIYIGALLFSMICNTFNGFAELSLTIQRLPAFYKHRDLLFHPPWAFTLPTFLLRIPISFFEATVWMVTTYYTIGFAPESSRFFKQFLLIFAIQQMAAGIFRPNPGLVEMGVLGFTFELRLQCPRSKRDVCSKMDEQIGELKLCVSFDIKERLDVGLMRGSSIGVHVLFNVLFTLALMYLNPLGKPQAIISKEQAREMEAEQEDTDGTPRLKTTKSKKDSLPRSLTSSDGNNTMEMTMQRMSSRSSVHELSRSGNSSVGTARGVAQREEWFYIYLWLCHLTTPGVLTALMGVSGAGKTTLMDVLAGRKTGGYIEGDIRISGFPKNQETFARISGYCEQNDIHSPQAFVDEVMDLVELDNLKDAIVGIPGVTGLSTEQRKRLTIAVELVANPSIIFMDEPTSGLDARAAAIVMRQGGHVIYAGPLGQHSQKVIEYFETIPGVPRIKEKYNPATWMLEASSVATEARLGLDFAEYYKSTSLYQRNKVLVEELSIPAPGAKNLYFSTQYSQPTWGQFKSCLWKQWWTYWRSPDYNLVRYFFTLACALLVGTIFWRVGTKKNTDTDLLTIIGGMYASVLFLGINNCSTVQPIVAVERTVFYRERAAGMYSALPYALAQVIVEIPYVLIQTTFYTLIVYAMVSFEWTAAKFFWFYFVTFFSFLYFTYYGMMTVAITPNHQVAAIFAAAFYALFNLFSGFFIPRPKIPKWWIWYYWICPVAWTVYGLIIGQYGDVQTTIRVAGTSTQPMIKQYIQDHFGYDPNFKGPVAAVLVGFAVFFAFMYAYCIKTLNFQTRVMIMLHVLDPMNLTSNIVRSS
ncbi:UNVERIFIED_CONTAM: ABC transporter G family member 35 [Sesamum calycinum]|uniref:ABC transporter G family member 35 n=1 Tax=Sesamum calycinum TaxID=2727403 RepID=A0AAW2SXQ9_9LAMI